MISGIVVLQATSRDAWQSAVLRVLGTLIGATIGGFYLHLFPFSTIGMAVSVGLTVLLCQALKRPRSRSLGRHHSSPDHCDSSGNPELSPFANAALRFSESVIGAGLAVVAVALAQVQRARLTCRLHKLPSWAIRASANTLNAC